MPNTFLVPQQYDLTPETVTAVYTVANGRSDVITIYICNRAITATTFRLARAPNGEANAVKHYIYYDTQLPANNTLKLTYTLNEADVMRVRSGAGSTVSVNVWPDKSEPLYISN